MRQPEVVFVAVVCALVTIAFGIYPEPLFDVAKDAGRTRFPTLLVSLAARANFRAALL